MNDLDVLWDGQSHQEIFEKVNTGLGASLTEAMEERLKAVAGVLDDLSKEVSEVIQRTGEAWQGSAADMATNAMWVLRDVDDGMYFTAKLADIRAFGQSDSAEWVRRTMPPPVEVKPPVPTGGLIDILNASVDFQQQQAAAKDAEQRARGIMRQYTQSTRERAAAMTPLAPIPQVVVEVTPPPTPPPPPPPPIVKPPRPHDPGDGPREPGPVQGPDGGPGPSQPGPAQPAPISPSVTPGPTNPSVVPAQGSGLVTVGSPTGGPVPAPGGPGTQGPPPVGGFANRGPGESAGPRPLSESPGRRGGSPGGDRGPAGKAPSGTSPVGRGATAMARGTATGAGGESPFGAGPGARREEDREHKVKYGVPTAEHFEPDDAELDPHRAGWYVAPQVIGDPNEEGEHR